VNFQEAKETIAYKNRERKLKKDLRETEERMAYLSKFIRKYIEERRELKEIHSKERWMIKNIPSDKEVREAQKVIEEYSLVSDEIVRLKRKRAKYG
jgi:Tfp pilus assembly protein PilO